MSRIDHHYTDEITCPYCGEVVDDSWELEDEGEWVCCECGLRFYYTRHVEVTYTTHAVKPTGDVDWMDENDEKD